MTEYKVGDKVHVEYNGFVTHVPRNSDCLEIQSDSMVDDAYYVDERFVTKVAPALPTKPNAVIRSAYFLPAVLANGKWAYPDSEDHSRDVSDARVRVRAVRYGFEVLYEGDDK